jgi:hypothetical protein
VIPKLCKTAAAFATFTERAFRQKTTTTLVQPLAAKLQTAEAMVSSLLNSSFETVTPFAPDQA